MKVQVVCPGCGKRSNVDSDRVGKKLRCKACETVFQVSAPSANSSIDDTSWLDDGADGEPAALPSHSGVRRSRSASADGSSANLTIAIGAGAVALVALVIGIAVLLGGGGAPAPGEGRGQPGEDQAAASGLIDSVVNSVAGPSPTDDAAGYPDVGPLLPPLLPPPPLRDLKAHEQRARATVAMIDRIAGILGTIRDAPSFKAAGEQFKALDGQARDEMTRNPEPFRMTPAEDADVTRRFADDMRRAMARIRQESERIAGLPGVGLAGVSLNSMFQMAVLPAEEALKRGEAFKPSSGPAPYAEVLVKLHGPDDAIALKDKLEGVLDADRGIQWTYRTQGDDHRASFRVWPVPDVEALAERIKFGKTSVKGRRIFVNAEPIPAAEVATAKEAQQKAEEARKAHFDKVFQREEDNDPKPPADADEVTKALFALRSANSNKRKDGVARLIRIEPRDDRRDEVHEQIAPMLDDSDTFLVSEAMKALVRWRTDDTVPALVKRLEHSAHNVRWEAAELLGKLGDPRAAEPLIAHLKQDAIKVEPALRALGAAAEPALIGLLRHPESQTRVQACRILEDVGGKPALEAMMSLPADPDFFVQSAARDAMRAMQQRVGPIPTPGKNGPTKAQGGKIG